MDLTTLQRLLELGFPAVVLVLYLLERMERKKITREYLDSMRQIVHLPPMDDGDTHEFRISWNGSTKDDEKQKTP